MNQQSDLANTGRPGVEISTENQPYARAKLSMSKILSRLILLSILVTLDVAVLAYIPHNFALLGPIAPIAIVAFSAFVGLAYPYLKQQREPLPFSPLLLFVHLACIAAVSSANYDALRSPPSGLVSLIQIIILRLVLVAGLVFLALACIPLPRWIGMVRDTRWLSAQALLAGFVAWCLRFPIQSFWSAESSAPGRFLQALTFRCVAPLLHVVLPGVIIEPLQYVIGTDRFAVTIAEQCSGLEGLGLVLIFTLLWLWYFRREMRFPRALLLIPCALLTVWLLNIVRIATLVIIGSAGAPEIAMEGFHSQAGWIAFTLVALSFSIAARKVRWLQTRESYAAAASSSVSTETQYPQPLADVSERGESPAVAAYLVPFLAILATSFLSRAASGSFEWLYPLRVVAAALALWLYRGELMRLNWRFSWIALPAGSVIFAAGLAASHFLPSNTPSTLAESLSALPSYDRWIWIAFRVLAGAVTIPLAEELAFRGYLARRLIRLSKFDFDQQPFSAITLFSMTISSVLYGLMFGHLWPVGILAGLMYAILAKWKSRLGDAVVAHAISNLLLAAWIIATQSWSLW